MMTAALLFCIVLLCVYILQSNAWAFKPNTLLKLSQLSRTRSALYLARKDEKSTGKALDGTEYWPGEWVCTKYLIFHIAHYAH
jgi:hypothetical protein